MFPPAFFTVTSYSCKVNTMVFVILFLNSEFDAAYKYPDSTQLNCI